MKYISVCSGIEAATVAWHSLGWEPVAFAEIEAFPSAVLALHFPTVPNLGDISKIDWRPHHGTVDLVVGGTPCQSFSIAGRREGLDGASGLVFEYFRLLREVQPRWFVWENVPGSFSSNKGADFQSILREWDKLGYHVAWRVLDAQYFGVPQRRRRIFAVGHLGNWRYPAQVLFEPDCLRGNTPKGGKARKSLAAHAESGTRIDWPARVGSTLNAHFGEKMGLENQHINQSAPLFVPATVGTLTASGAGTSRPAGQRNELDFLVPSLSPTMLRKRSGCEGGGKGALLSEDRSLTLATSNDQVMFEPTVELMPRMAVRRLTPTECERLQGFPDGWTAIPWRGKNHAPDGPRYKALGNSMAVPCMRWIGERIQSVEDA
jgi:DNA (cytosine-5)-methyltransferase 1